MVLSEKQEDLSTKGPTTGEAGSPDAAVAAAAAADEALAAAQAADENTAQTAEAMAQSVLSEAISSIGGKHCCAKEKPSSKFPPVSI